MLLSIVYTVLKRLLRRVAMKIRSTSKYSLICTVGVISSVHLIYYNSPIYFTTFILKCQTEISKIRVYGIIFENLKEKPFETVRIARAGGSRTVAFTYCMYIPAVSPVQRL